MPADSSGRIIIGAGALGTIGDVTADSELNCLEHDGVWPDCCWCTFLSSALGVEVRGLGVTGDDDFNEDGGNDEGRDDLDDEGVVLR